MYLYPYKIFALSKNKVMFNKDNIKRKRGLYDVEKMNYRQAQKVKEEIDGSYISVLLGEVKSGVYLNCLDLDGYKDSNGNLTPEARTFLKDFPENEVEDSVSKTGGHIYFLTTKQYKTFKIKEYFGKGEHKDLEVYSDKRHIVSTTIDFNNIDFKIGKYDDIIDNLYKEYTEKQPKTNYVETVREMFNGKIINDMDQLQNSVMTGRTPVTDMYTLRGCGYKDNKLIELIDAEPSTVNQSDHDAALLRKLMYYTLSFESAYEMAKKTNYYKNKDERHKKKFEDARYIERTRQFIMKGHI